MNRKVLLLDADPAERAALSFSLELEGFDVESFADCGLLDSRTEPFGSACLLLDQRLAGANGLEYLTQLRQRGVQSPAAVMVTNPTRALQQLADAATARLIEKPLLDDALPALLRELLAGGVPIQLTGNLT